MFFKIKTVSSILASFSSTLRELESHAELRAAAAVERTEAAARATAEAVEHSAEADAARKVAAKLRDLIA